jgi:hypothetical protein
MPDSNITPDLDIKVPMSAKTADRLAWTAWIMTILGGGGGAVAALALVPDFYRQLAAGIGTVLMVVAQLIQRKLPSAEQMAKLRKAAGSGAAGLLAVILLAGCPNAWSGMWKGTGGLMEATKSMSKGGAAVGTVKHDECIKKGAKTVAYWDCIKKTRAYLVTYRDTARPAARTSVAVAYASIRTAEEAKNEKLDWIALLKPGACALITSLREWGHKLPDKGKVIMSFLQPFGGMTCDKAKNPKSAAAIITALLPVAVDLVRWVINLVGADNSEIKAKINAWIQGPATDEVDALLKKIDAAAPGGVL